MDTRSEGKPVGDLRDYLAEERTFLAWVRTGIALMGFGLVVAHIGIVAGEAQPASTPPVSRRTIPRSGLEWLWLRSA
jgi:uncharacterized membrane protein YidH (DUF202 family)